MRQRMPYHSLFVIRYKLSIVKHSGGGFSACINILNVYSVHCARVCIFPRNYLSLVWPQKFLITKRFILVISFFSSVASFSERFTENHNIIITIMEKLCCWSFIIFFLNMKYTFMSIRIKHKGSILGFTITE